MVDALTAGAHAARFTRPGAAELVGRSAAIARVQELVRRAATLDGGVLLTAEPGTAVDSVARELHARGRHSAAPYVIVECANGDAARLDRVLFGATVRRTRRPISSRCRATAGLRRHAVGSFFSRTSPSSPPVAGASRTYRARRRSANRSDADPDRVPACRERGARNRRRRVGSPISRGSLSPVVGCADRHAAARARRGRARARGPARGGYLHGRGLARGRSRRRRSRC